MWIPQRDCYFIYKQISRSGHGSKELTPTTQWPSGWSTSSKILMRLLGWLPPKHLWNNQESKHFLGHVVSQWFMAATLNCQPDHPKWDEFPKGVPGVCSICFRKQEMSIKNTSKESCFLLHDSFFDWAVGKGGVTRARWKPSVCDFTAGIRMPVGWRFRGPNQCPE